MKIQLDAPEDVERPELIRTLRHRGRHWGEWCRLLHCNCPLRAGTRRSSVAEAQA